MKLRNLILIFVFLAPTYVFSATCPSTTSDFVTRTGTTLCYQGKVFKFASFNMPGLTMVEDPIQQFDPVSQQWNSNNHDQFRAPTKEELEDAISTLVQMGTRVTRIYPPTIRSSGNTDDQSYFTWDSGNSQFVINPTLFRKLDYLLQLAKQNNIKIIFPFIDANDFSHGNGGGKWGGISAFCAKFGLSCPEQSHLAFYKDLEKQFINQIVLPIVTRYKDNPAILAWETGNELEKCFWSQSGSNWQCTTPVDDTTFSQWTKAVTAAIKNVDKNHLIMDGAMQTSERHYTSDDGIDIVSFHAYPGSKSEQSQVGTRYVDEQSQPATKANKAFVIGEMGLCYLDSCIQPTLARMLDGKTNLSGVLLWSMRFHQKDINSSPIAGGYFDHVESSSFLTPSNTHYRAYHWPGSHLDDNYQEIDVVAAVQKISDQLQGMPLADTYPRISTPPSKPQIVSVTRTDTGAVEVTFWGGAGAQSYTIVRTSDSTPLSTGYSEIKVQQSGSTYTYGYEPYLDTTAPQGTLSYTVIAVNSAGSTASDSQSFYNQ
ncbi:glycoside hydrolase family 5 protein [Vibrio sp. S4M6]|uniref:cellulase family glycosylhydrolase n=1 Tax=Vibrio sinus TaxID=2946865 RepID=UPI00202A1E7E|nr:cellulase family glycosylhydrolase [Vibrio sinus]MCL9781586.1 glycoside hydrolase family 5 protein [Vibrio sinus]